MDLIIYLAIIGINACITLLIVDYRETKRQKKEQETINFLKYLAIKRR